MPEVKHEPTPEEVALDLGEVYFIEKDAKAEKDKLRLTFFDAITAECASGPLATKTFIAPKGMDGVGAAIMAARYNPGWVVLPPEGKLTDPIRVVLEEDPDYKPGVVTVACVTVDIKGGVHPGYHITKSIVSGSTLLDDERLKADNRTLYDQVTEADMPDWITGNSRNILAAFAPRRIKSPDEMTDEQMDAVASYVYEGPKTKKLLVRYAKPEEIE